MRRAVCQHDFKRQGFTAKGKQRWQCRTCGYSTINPNMLPELLTIRGNNRISSGKDIQIRTLLAQGEPYRVIRRLTGCGPSTISARRQWQSPPILKRTGEMGHCDYCGKKLEGPRDFDRRKRRAKHKFCTHVCYVVFYREVRSKDRCKRCGLSRYQTRWQDKSFTRGLCAECDTTVHIRKIRKAAIAIQTDDLGKALEASMSKLIKLSTNEQIANCNDADALLSELRECASNVLRNISRMAAILRRLDELGVEVEIDHALIPFIRMIANGALSAECFVACSGDPSLLGLATTLPPALQEKVARNEPLKLLGPGGEHRMVGALDMNRLELRQAFTKGGLRSDDEQAEFLERSKRQPASEKIDFLESSGPRPRHSAIGVELDWAAKKIVAAAVRWHQLDEESSDKERARALDELTEAIEEYLEMNAAAA